MRRATFAISLVILIGAGPQDEPERSADRGDRMICKRFMRTGSLVDGYRDCKTKREWEKERENRRQMSVSNSCRDFGALGSSCK